MIFSLKKNGSFNIVCNTVSLTECYPAINNIPVRPCCIEITENTAVYNLEDGYLTLHFCAGKTKLEISAECERINPHDVSYIHSGRLTGCTKAFVQGQGIGGPSGFRNISDGNEHCSDGVTAIGNDGELITVHTADNALFRTRFTIKEQTLYHFTDTEEVLDDTKPLPVLKIQEETSFDSALRSCAEDIAEFMNARKVTVPAYHWCSWYYLYHTLDQQTLDEYLEGFSKYRNDIPFTHIQLDVGYFPSCGDWLEYGDRFPKGLKYAADRIKEYGYEPAIWIGPFMVGDESKLYKEHPDWILRNRDGSPLINWRWYNEPKVWGYRDFDYYVLDISNPDAMAYIRHVFRTLKEWGFSMFKTDFLFWGLQDSSKVLRHSPGKTSYEYYRMMMSAIREEIGESRWLGCIAPFLPSIGYVDMMRIGGDVGSKWEPDEFGPVNMINEIVADQYFNNVYWQNDPDAYMIRDFHIYIGQQQIEALSLLAAMSGGTVYTSDPIHKISENRRKLLSFVKPGPVVRPEFPEWQDGKKDTCIVNKLQKGTLIYYFNGTLDDVFEMPDWKKLAGNKATNIREYNRGVSSAEELKLIKLEPRSGRLFFVSDEEIPDEPRNLWDW